MTEPLRVGIIGGGWIARVHVPAIEAAPELELVAACDTVPERADAIAAACGGAAYARFEEMLEGERLDALWVCTPPLGHRAPVEAALAAGVHVYLEKPIARTLEDADAIVAAAEAADAICAVGYQYHASELLDDARALLEGQQVGLLVSRNFGPVAGRPWFMDRAQGGGQILERASHHIDLQQALAGRIATVEATAGSVDLSRADRPNGIEDAVTLTFHFDGGTLGAVHTAWTRRGPTRALLARHRREPRDARAAARPARLPAHGTIEGIRRHAGARGADGALDRPLRRGDAGVGPAPRGVRTRRGPGHARRGARLRARARDADTRRGGAMTTPRIERIDHIGIVVADFSAHVEQLEALGLELRRDGADDQTHVRHYLSGDATIELIDVLDEQARSERLAGARQARIEHIAFEVESLEEVRAALEARGVELSWPPYPSASGPMIWTVAETSLGVQYQFFVRHAVVRIGIVGAGAIAHRHAASLRTRAGVEIAVVCDVDEARAARLAAELRARVIDELADDARGARARLRVRLHPAGRARRRGGGRARPGSRRLSREAARADARGREAHPRGLALERLDLRRRLPVAQPRSAHGAARRARHRRAGHARQPQLRPDRARPRRPRGAGGSWFVDPDRSGGILFELASHDLDLQCALAGRVVSVQAASASGHLALAGARATGLDDALALTMRFASGTLGSALVAWTDAPDPPVYSLDVLGTDVALSLRCEPAFQLSGRAHGSTVLEQGRIDPRESTLDRFLDAVRLGDRARVPCSPADAFGTLATATACEEAIATGARVAVEAG